MTLGQQSNAVLLVAIAIYVIGGLLLLIRRKPVRAGLLMVLASLTPLTWQVAFTDSDAKGFGLLLLLMLPTALGVTLCGMIWWVYLFVAPDQPTRQP